MPDKSKSPPPDQRAGNPKIGDEAVKAKTGKNWQGWFTVLDKANAKNLNHTEIATYLYKKQKLDGWWAQMIAVTYEQERGLRQKYERPGGYEISVSKVVPVTLSALYKSWNDEKLRNQWLKEKELTIRKATANKSMRVSRVDNKTSLEVNFYAKGDSKAQVVVQHSKLANMTEAEKMKKYWREKLEKLNGMLGKG